MFPATLEGDQRLDHTLGTWPRQEAKGGQESGMAWAGVAQREWPDAEESLGQQLENGRAGLVCRRGC